MVYTADGFTWTPSGGRRAGLPTIGAVQPPEHRSAQPHHQVYDVIVIGAGYAGLIAARDLATQGKTTLLLEARDRLGGRTWNATINGFNYEMGGTWIHWHMPHIYREVSYYGLHNDFIVTQNPGSKEDYFTATTGTRQRNMSHDEEADIAGRVMRIFCNVDGHHLKHSWKYPFATGQSPALMAQWDKRSCKDRLDEIRDQLSAEQLSVLESQLLQMGGSSLDKIGLLGSGQSELHRRIFEHAKATGNLSYRFQTPIRRIEDAGHVVAVTSRDGQTYKAKSVICTIPLNVLSSVDFSPPLPADKLAAIQHRSVNRCNKVHIDLNGPDYLSWSSLGTPGKGLVSAFGDHLTNANNSHLVCFGPDPDTPSGLSLDNVESIKSAVIHLLPKDKQDEVIINRIVSHDWNNDEFAKGTWCFMEPEATTNHLSALQRPHGNILFASGDWSDGWRGWIDGAVQSGTQAAKTVMLQTKVSGNNVPKVQKTANGV
ncbi:hypothetical protein MY10362_005357 [Beauveria mimosiformis]